MNSNFLHSFLTLCFSFLITFFSSIAPHGFGEHTIIKTGDGPYFWSLGQVARKVGEGEKPYVASYNSDSNQWIKKRVTAAGFSETNCYCRMSFDEHSSRPLECTPSQLFYRIDDHQWVAAYMLRTGDLLLCDGSQTINVANITLINKPLKVYTIEVNETHTFLVTEHGVVVHNMLVPIATAIGFSAPLHLGCGGASLGSILGPVGVVGGIVIGGVIGYLLNACIKSTIAEYELSFKPHAIATLMESNKNSSKKHEQNKESSHRVIQGSNMTPEDPDDEDEESARKKQRPLTNKEARNQAKKMGYEEVKDAPFNNRGALTFRKGNTFISVDQDCHKGGVWKMANRSGMRIGTWNIDLTKMIGG